MGMLELVVIILGIIVAGGFLLYFLGDLLMSMATKGKRDERLISEKQNEQTKALQERLNALPNAEELKKNPAIASVLLNGGMVEAYNPEEEEKLEQEAKAVEEEISEVEEAEEISEINEAAEEAQVEDVEEETEVDDTEDVEEEEEVDDIADYIAQRRKELMEKLARIKQENADEEEESLDLDETEEETETAEEETEESAPVEEEETETEEENAAEEEAEVEEKQEPVAAPAPTAVAQQPAAIVRPVIGNLAELEEKLALAQERLKSNEKELRRCKKEYIPLRKVKKTLEKDENKLRRKEALVAKQKVMLYGVNNYSDIDEEKAKKLAEDLDLLDGLKLSVQHCHEVMNNNKERYPLLEQIYNLLVNKNNDLKEEIKALQAAIEKAKAEN